MITLNGQWKMKQVKEKEWHQGTVPGTVYTDLLTQGLIVDPYVGENEDEVLDLSYNEILSDNYFDLLPGESKTVWVEEIRSEKEVNQKTLSEEIVLTSNYDVAK